jgi:hypothetical protein
VVQVSSPLGHHYVSGPPPLLGWGSDHLTLAVGTETAPTTSESTTPRTPGGSGRTLGPVHRRKRPLRRPRTVRNALEARSVRRPRLTSHLERELGRYLT